jgi:uncharacterized protein YndB with AHSA1/START domain
MKLFDVQAIQIAAPFARVFDFIAEERNLPRWTSAFRHGGGGRALMETPSGSVEVGLRVNASREHGTIDWQMTFPDGVRATAYSRLVELEATHSAYSFVLTAPPVPLEQLEGALHQQARTLREELDRLRSLLEANE